MHFQNTSGQTPLRIAQNQILSLGLEQQLVTTIQDKGQKGHPGQTTTGLMARAKGGHYFVVSMCDLMT